MDVRGWYGITVSSPPKDLQLVGYEVVVRTVVIETHLPSWELQADREISELYLDEDTFTMYGREGGRFVDLVGEKRVDEYHILDRSTRQLKVRSPELSLQLQYVSALLCRIVRSHTSHALAVPR